MRMEAEARAEIGPQVAPDVAVAPDPVAEQHGRRRTPLTPRLVEQRAAIAGRDGVTPRRLHPSAPQAISFSSSSPGNSFTDGILHDLLAGDLPGFLDNPRQGPVLPGRFVLDFLQHVFGKIEGLLALIGAGHTRASFEDRLQGVKTSAGVRGQIRPGGCHTRLSSLSYRAFFNALFAADRPVLGETVSTTAATAVQSPHQEGAEEVSGTPRREAQGRPRAGAPDALRRHGPRRQ